MTLFYLLGLLMDWYIDGAINYQIAGIPVCKGFFKIACGFNDDMFDKIVKNVLIERYCNVIPS
jgi:hypothetical protein